MNTWREHIDRVYDLFQFGRIVLVHNHAVNFSWRIRCALAVLENIRDKVILASHCNCEVCFGQGRRHVPGVDFPSSVVEGYVDHVFLFNDARFKCIAQ